MEGQGDLVSRLITYLLSHPDPASRAQSARVYVWFQVGVLYLSSSVATTSTSTSTAMDTCHTVLGGCVSRLNLKPPAQSGDSEVLMVGPSAWTMSPYACW